MPPGGHRSHAHAFHGTNVCSPAPESLETLTAPRTPNSGDPCVSQRRPKRPRRRELANCGRRPPRHSWGSTASTIQTPSACSVRRGSSSPIARIRNRVRSLDARNSSPARQASGGSALLKNTGSALSHQPTRARNGSLRQSWRSPLLLFPLSSGLGWLLGPSSAPFDLPTAEPLGLSICHVELAHALRCVPETMRIVAPYLQETPVRTCRIRAWSSSPLGLLAVTREPVRANDLLSNLVISRPVLPSRVLRR
jgi:hypothetical protein